MDFQDVIKDLKKLSNPTKAKILQRFFKTGKGEYGEGDIFWGITVPDIRKISKKYKSFSIKQIRKLIKHQVHEIRLCGLLILVENFKKDPENIYRFYLAHTKYVNNWDLVDLTAGHIISQYLFKKDKTTLYLLAKSKNLWERRIAIIATFYFIKKGFYQDTFKIAEILLNDKHDLIHKAVGWMLREIGKQIDEKIEEEFLKKYAVKMPRVMLRYAIERLPKNKRNYYLKLKP